MSVDISSLHPVKNVKGGFLQGRFIVHPDETKDLQFHETTVDYPEGLSTKDKSNYFRSNFTDLKTHLKEYFKTGINCLYLAGVFERDNLPDYDGTLFKKVYRRPEASLLAYTSRDRPNSMLGGEEKF